MKVITSESVIIQKIKAVPSKESWTKNPNYMARYSSADGLDKSQVQPFQVWASMYHSAMLSPDGIFGPKTKAAYAKYGKEWKKNHPPVILTSSPLPPKKETAPVVNQDKPVVDSQTKDFVVTNSKTGFIEKIKALPVPAKIGIGVGVAAVLSLIVWKLIPSKKG